MLLIFHEPIELLVTEKFNWTTLNIKSGAEQRFCYPTPSASRLLVNSVDPSPFNIIKSWHYINPSFGKIEIEL